MGRGYNEAPQQNWIFVIHSAFACSQKSSVNLLTHSLILWFEVYLFTRMLTHSLIWRSIYLLTHLHACLLTHSLICSLSFGGLSLYSLTHMLTQLTPLTHSLGGLSFYSQDLHANSVTYALAWIWLSFSCTLTCWLAHHSPIHPSPTHFLAHSLTHSLEGLLTVCLYPREVPGLCFPELFWVCLEIWFLIFQELIRNKEHWILHLHTRFCRS